FYMELMMREIFVHKAWERYIAKVEFVFAYEMDEDSRFRGNFLKQYHRYAAVFLVIPLNIMTLEQLGVPLQIAKFGEMRSGLVLVTGPTGSGKSTTLAALMDYINVNYARHIITVEEPIEFVHKNKKCIMTQREVPMHCPTFKDGL